MRARKAFSMSNTIRFASLRTSLFTVLGLSVAACGANVRDSDTDDPQAKNDGGARDGEASSVCEDAEAILTKAGDSTGFFRCPDGSRHRVEAVTLPPPELRAGDCKGTEGSRSCSTDADCTAMPYGRCISGNDYRMPDPDDQVEGTPERCDCRYSCASDADCASGEACIPGGVVSGQSVPFCAPASCKTGDDCASGECGLSVQDDDGCHNRIVKLACRSKADSCRVDAECSGSAEQCIYASERFQCMGPDCAIGRPLLIDGQPRTAAPTSRADWAASDALPDTTGIDLFVRNELANHWLEIAAMEHASIGSFARFSLQLLALGAPPSLLADTQKAALDEIEHARIAYALASAYAGRKLGPGPLDASDAPLATSRREAIRSLIFEACVNETLGAAEALAIADNVRDPALAGVLRRIANDEQRHAELAWRALAWLLESASVDETEVAQNAFAEAIRGAAHDPEVLRSPFPEHGVLDAQALGSLRRQVLAEVIEPCASALLDQSKIAA